MSVAGGHDERGGLHAQEFLSVDVDAQLRKLPGRRNLSRHHYPVELVRGALARGAGRVTVAISRSAVEVSDDGSAPSQSVLSALVTAFDASRPDDVRTAALEFFEDGRGLELLAAFAPEPSSVEILCAAQGGSRRFSFLRGRFPVDELLESPRVGTRVRILRSGNARREREAVFDHCRFAAVHVELNGRNVAPAQPPDALAATRIDAASEHGPGVLWIPSAGDVCRVRMLRNGIVWRQAALPARLGFLFHVALEGDDLPSGAALENLRLAAEEQYRLLVRRFRSLDASQQARTDELMFLLHRRGGESNLVLSYAPFRVRGGDERLSVAGIMALADAGPLAAVRSGSLQDRATRRGGDLVLALTDRQREFLVTDLGLRLLSPTLPEGSLAGRLARTWEWAVDLASGRFNLGREQVPDDLLDEQERAFRDALAVLLTALPPERPAAGVVPAWPGGWGHAAAGEAADGPMRAGSVVFVEATGRRCWSLLRGREGEMRLAIHRRHRHVRAAVAAFSRDPANLRLFVALLAEGGGALPALP